MSNFIPVPIITRVERSPTLEEEINQESLEYSTDENLRKAYRDGAHAQYDAIEKSGWYDLMEIVIILTVLVQGISFFIGVVETSKYTTCRAPGGKWGYVFPLYKVGCNVSEWMAEE
jgi:hypothetical protein